MGLTPRRARPPSSMPKKRDRETRIYVLHGQDKTFTVKPDPGYEIKTVKVDGVEVEIADPQFYSHTFPRVISDGHSIEATFSKSEYIVIGEVQPDDDGNVIGTITPTSTTVEAGGSVEFIIEPDDCHRIHKVVVIREGVEEDVTSQVDIKPDGTGLYYDFSDVADGEKIKADDVYRCSKK